MLKAVERCFHPLVDTSRKNLQWLLDEVVNGPQDISKTLESKFVDSPSSKCENIEVKLLSSHHPLKPVMVQADVEVTLARCRNLFTGFHPVPVHSSWLRSFPDPYSAIEPSIRSGVTTESPAIVASPHSLSCV